MKPALTKQQKDKFETTLKNIVLEHFPTGIIIYWNPLDMPIIEPNEFINNLSPKAKQQYASLMHQLKERTL